MSVPYKEATEIDSGILFSDTETENEVGVFAGDENPWVKVPDAPQGSLYLKTTGETYRRDVKVTDGLSTEWSQTEADLDALNTSIAAITTELDTHTEHLRYIDDNKFFNGAGEKLSKENWALPTFNNFTYSQNDSDLAFGHVAYQHAANRTPVRSEYDIFVNPYSIYRIEASFKHRRTAVAGDPILSGNPASGDPGSYLGITQYDNAGFEILPMDNRFLGGSLSTLISPYTPGDATIEVDNVTGWNFTFASTFNRAIIAWDYTDSFGKLWMPHTYARKRFVRDLWAQNAVPTAISGGFSIPVNTSPITSRFEGPQILPTGTKISQGSSGGTYKYCVALNSKFPVNGDEWERRYGYIGGLDLSGNNELASFSPGTASIRILMLPVWSNSYQTDELLVSNISMRVDSSANKVYTLTTNPGPKNTKISSIRKPIAAGSNVTSQLMTNGIMENN